MDLKDRLKALFPANDMISEPFQPLPTWERWANEELYENRDGVVIRSGLYLRDRKYITDGFLGNKKAIEDEATNRVNADQDLNNRLKVVEQNQGGGTQKIVSTDARNHITEGSDKGAYLGFAVAAADQPDETNVAIVSVDSIGTPNIIGGLEFKKTDFVIENDPNAHNFVTVETVDKPTDPADLISTDANNEVKLGTDGKLLVTAPAATAPTFHGLTVDPVVTHGDVQWSLTDNFLCLRFNEVIMSVPDRAQKTIGTISGVTPFYNYSTTVPVAIDSDGSTALVTVFVATTGAIAVQAITTALETKPFRINSIEYVYATATPNP